jgi:hypothetical protein
MMLRRVGAAAMVTARTYGVSFATTQSQQLAEGSPPVTTNHASDVPYPLPRRIEWVRVSIASPTRAAFPK